MSEFTEIILRLLWRFYPIAWLTSIIVRALSRITSWLEDEESWLQLAHDPDDCAFVGGWLALAEDRLNELIVWKAMKLLKRPYLPPRSKDQFAGHVPARAVRTPQEIYRRLARLIVLYHDHKRLYEKRAQTLQRLFATAEFQLETIHHPVESTTTTTTILSVFRSSPAAAAAAAAAGFSVSLISGAPHPAQPIRAPPWLGLISDNPELIPTRRPCLRERDIMSETIADRRLTPPTPLIHHLSRLRSLDVQSPRT